MNIMHVQNISPFEQRLLNEIQASTRNTGTPCRTTTLVALTGQSDRTIRWCLVRLERAGVLARLTPRSGWFVRGSGLDKRIQQARTQGEFVKWVQREFGLYPRQLHGLREVLQ